MPRTAREAGVAGLDSARHRAYDRPMFEHPEADPEELALEELEFEDEELDDEGLPPEGPESEFLRRLDEHETVPLEEDEESADI